ncbi:hypothetical protein [Azospirillum sp. B2RO_4]|uniref:hypothetical protein n=1 Tax=Azospirillum sp. B2RO_4 TaxID=3027796 RepID=UPI003DA806F8
MAAPWDQGEPNKPGVFAPGGALVMSIIWKILRDGGRRNGFHIVGDVIDITNDADAVKRNASRMMGKT